MSSREERVALEGGATGRYRLCSASEPRSGAAILVLSGLGAEACDSPMLEPLLEALSAAGHLAVPVDWCGPHEARTVTGDVEAVLAVHEALIGRGIVEAAHVALIGHSVGALSGALAASVASFAGLVVYGAAALRFADALEVGARRQLPLRGLSADVALREARLAGELYRNVLREGASRDALAPELAASLAAADLRDDSLFGARLSYLRSIDAIEPETLFRRISCEVHAIQGTYDWVVGENDAQLIAGWAHAGRATAVAGADHYLGAHADLSSSMRDRGRGAPSQAALDALVASCGLLLNHADG